MSVRQEEIDQLARELEAEDEAERARDERLAQPERQTKRNGSTPPPGRDQEAAERLARLSQADYDRVRVAEAEALGIRVSTLDEKTTVQILLGGLVPRPLLASNLTASTVFRAIDLWSPTLLVDELDSFLREDNDLRNVLNSGHNRGTAFILRAVGDDHKPTRFTTWAPKSVGLIGKLPATLASRSIHIRMRRKTRSEVVTELRPDRTGHLDPLLRQSARWASDNAIKIQSTDPEMPEEIYGRAADNWRPLLAIAEVVGGKWPEHMRSVAKEMAGKIDQEVAAVLLLHDVADIFAERATDRLPSKEIIDALTVMEERPWPEWKDRKPMTPSQLAQLMGAFNIVPTTIRLADGRTPKGYYLKAFFDVLSQYPRPHAATTPQDPENNDFSENNAATSQEDVAANSG